MEGYVARVDRGSGVLEEGRTEIAIDESVGIELGEIGLL